jgi:hypothetical protein
VLGRREIEALEKSDAMTVLPAMRKALRRPAIDGQRICIDLAGCTAETAEGLRRKLAIQPSALY